MSRTPRRPRVVFVLEQHLGHATYAANLHAALHDHPDVDTAWTPVRYAAGRRSWIERVPIAGVRAILRCRAEVSDGLRDRHDAIVFNTQVPAVIGPRAARRRPYVLCSDVTPRQYDEMAADYDHATSNRLVAWAKDRWNRRVFRAAAAHAPWSSFVRESLITDYGVPPERIHVVPPGVDIERWRPADSPRVHDGPLRVLFVGGHFARKGGDVLLAALDRLPAGSVEVDVVTRDDVPATTGVRVHRGLSPNDDALVELYRAADVFVLASRAEAFGIAAVEAAASGLALVVTDVGGLRDLVVDGVTGFAVPAGSSEALAVALRKLADDRALCARMGAAARTRAEAEFDAGANARRLLALAVRSAGSSPLV